jgi:hypothetical protein
VGTVKSVEAGEDDTKTLRSIKFQTGDFMDVAIKGPGARTGVQARDRGDRPPVSRGRGVVAVRDDRGGRPWR